MDFAALIAQVTTPESISLMATIGFWMRLEHRLTKLETKLENLLKDYGRDTGKQTD